MQKPVVPRKGDVDRNAADVTMNPTAAVVPRKGDVDRNYKIEHGFSRCTKSSPARGTWIEMISSLKIGIACSKSSPARGTWIEIPAQIARTG